MQLSNTVDGSGASMPCKLSTIFFAFLLLASWTVGQSTFGEIIGVVKDPGEGLVAGAQVTLVNVEEHDEHSATTDVDGGFHFVNLKPGENVTNPIK
jgi:hypothetical protein